MNRIKKPRKLTPEQIANWRKMMSAQLGPYAYLMPDEDVQKYKDKMQERVDKFEKGRKP